MDRDRPVEVLFSCAHFDRDSEALHHLVHSAADCVQSDDSFVFADDDELQERGDLVLREAVKHAVELRLVHLVLAVGLLGLLLAEPDHAEGGVGEHDCRDVVVVQPALCLSSEDPMGQLLPGRDGHRGQLDLARDVAERVQSFDVGVFEVVRRHEPVLHPQSRVLQLQVPDVPGPPDGAVDLLVDVALPSVEGRSEPALGRLDLSQLSVSQELDSGLLHRTSDHVGSFMVKDAQELVRPQQHRRLHSEGLEQACQLRGYVAVADDQHALGSVLEGEEVVTCLQVLFAWDFEDGRFGPCRDQDVRGGEGLARDVYCVGVGEAGPAAEIIDFLITEKVVVAVVDVCDVGFAACAELLPVLAVGD